MWMLGLIDSQRKCCHFDTVIFKAPVVEIFNVYMLLLQRL